MSPDPQNQAALSPVPPVIRSNSLTSKNLYPENRTIGKPNERSASLTSSKAFYATLAIISSDLIYQGGVILSTQEIKENDGGRLSVQRTPSKHPFGDHGRK